MNRIFGAALACVVVAAGWLRIQQCHEGLPYLHVWDEPQTASNALRMMKTGDFDPAFFNYGTTMTYLSLLVDCVHALTLLGAPPGSPESLGAVTDVQINTDTGWHWTISHPSFYLWNRVLVGTMGAATVALVGLIGRRVAGAPAGLAAAVVLAGASVPIRESAVIINDGPLAFFVVWAAWEALRFQVEGRLRSLVWSCVAVGLAIGCKYTAGIALIFPWGALVARRGPASPLAWPLALGVPALTFLASTPYAVLNLPLFLNQVGWELRHYHVLGHGESTITPGWPNLRYQLSEIRACLGPAFFLAIAGLATLWRRQGWVVWLFPVVYAAYMCNTKINFTRNFLVLYPFIALSAGCAMAWGYQRARGGLRLGGALLFWALSLVWLGLAVPGALAARTPETRTAMADILASERWDHIGIPSELRVHELDLRALRRKDVRVAPLQELMCGSDREVVVVPVMARSDSAPLEALAFNALLPPVEAVLLHGPQGKGELWLDRLTVNPQLRVVPASSSACASRLISAEMLEKPSNFEVTDGVLLAITGGAVRTPGLPVGAWTAHWLLRGQQAGDEDAKVLLTAGSSSVAVDVGTEWAIYTLAADAAEVFTAEFVNDAMIAGKDRNVEIGGVWVEAR